MAHLPMQSLGSTQHRSVALDETFGCVNDVSKQVQPKRNPSIAPSLTLEPSPKHYTPEKVAAVQQEAFGFDRA